MNIQMSSVTRFLKQIPLATTYYTAPSDTSSQPQAGIYFQFDPENPPNYVGNYPPGVMTDVTATVSAVIDNIASGHTAILRDLGKTFRAAVADINSVADTQVGFFRHVQLLDVTGDVTADTFKSHGVIGGPTVPSVNAKYYNIYVAVPVTGAGYVSPGIYPIAGGQM